MSPGQATRTLAALEDQWAPEFASVIKTAYGTGNHYPLYRAHRDFHKAIVAAGLTPGHLYENEISAFLERHKAA
ncbi:hypothetical protein K466DRAFT_598989 [Polyporus arcularius HHB13444]|uniref:Uncharacterized protein n=1 Tax=Polyporus arcularius HHB13444 TaxID=1314778 RepID=A0A5C3PI60_9APHY|nr:hypothetical protein K466DRAFT_598989 [Polyporus arcularius HHB13444]